MFKVGDKVVCVIDSTIDFYLDKSKIYTICDIFDGDIQLEEIPGIGYSIHRFMTIIEYRKQKLQKICSSQEIR